MHNYKPRHFGDFTVIPYRVTMTGAVGTGRGDISLVGRETLPTGVVGSCVSAVGIAISDVVLTRRGGEGPPTVEVITVPGSVLTKYDRCSGVRLIN